MRRAVPRGHGGQAGFGRQGIRRGVQGALAPASRLRLAPAPA